ncbi:MAG: hypothetical protein ACRDTE_11065 [Pseudonocardiaceae bacterium]
MVAVGKRPTTPPVSLAEALQSTPPVAPPPPGSDERFLQLLNVRGYVGRNPRADASVVYANLAAGGATRYHPAPRGGSSPVSQVTE